MSSKNLKERARELRRFMTPAESCLWSLVRHQQLGVGIQFRRQYVMGPYIVDFICHSAKLVVECDGEPHTERKEYDVIRDEYLTACGFRVLRFWNHDILHKTEEVLSKLKLFTSIPSPSSGAKEGSVVRG